ncbi:hypothetical protein [Acinetobacter bouvetii]|uniref:Uncharacterized protein n=1 Tax=Acinetobacter bouvetii TaxID=202951 RepID=A0A811G8S1_9GAMM|nr:hypothetical protein [Acinetobacter bouvetii]CAB1208417.1 hypothetical protein SFB21_0388 [Acinetobacter bouvetii]
MKVGRYANFKNLSKDANGKDRPQPPKDANGCPMPPKDANAKDHPKPAKAQ